jgi:hypothetical protein
MRFSGTHMSVFATKKNLRERAMSACRARRMAEWLLLFVSSSLLVGALRAARLPAALLLGPMIAAIGFAWIRRWSLRQPPASLYRSYSPLNWSG